MEIEGATLRRYWLETMTLIDKNWEKLFDKYKIEEEIEKRGLFYITADQIREFKEPRLMTKFDTRESLPLVFKEKLGILPVTRGKYVIGEYDLYKDFPETKTRIKQMGKIKVPEYYETIDIHNITSEANAINVMGISLILDDFLEEDNMVQTISGRMGSGDFNFFLHNKKEKGNPYFIEVSNSQIEIDGGFENANIFTLIEGKNVVHSNFLVRQIYYPFRVWNKRIHKPIRPVFMVYFNNVFRLMEYEFTDLNDYNSLKLIQEKSYSLEDVGITLEDLAEVMKKTIVIPEPEVTFPQADSFDKVISLIENLSEDSMSAVEIADLFGFRERQSDYYFNACKYLGLAMKKKDSEKKSRVFMTPLARKFLKMNYKTRQLEYVKLILGHQIFYEIFETALRTRKIPDKYTIAVRMRELKLCSENIVVRRASTVGGWVRWIFSLINE